MQPSSDHTGYHCSRGEPRSTSCDSDIQRDKIFHNLDATKHSSPTPSHMCLISSIWINDSLDFIHQRVRITLSVSSSQPCKSSWFNSRLKAGGSTVCFLSLLFGFKTQEKIIYLSWMTFAPDSPGLGSL